MSGGEEDPMLFAAEYALGSLDRAEMREAEAIAARDPAFASEVGFWQQKFGLLGDLVAPVTPPPTLWLRLELAVGAANQPRQRSSGRFWRGTTALSLAIAAGLALFAFLPRPPSPEIAPARFAAALAPLSSPARFLVETRSDGGLMVSNLGGGAAPAGRDYELWALPPGGTVPVSLGVLPTGTRVITPPRRPLAQEMLLVSDEPVGGSPTGAPTGAVLFGGSLVPINPAARPGP